jgi:hypothetical protein
VTTLQGRVKTEYCNTSMRTTAQLVIVLLFSVFKPAAASILLVYISESSGRVLGSLFSLAQRFSLYNEGLELAAQVELQDLKPTPHRA